MIGVRSNCIHLKANNKDLYFHISNFANGIGDIQKSRRGVILYGYVGNTPFQSRLCFNNVTNKFILMDTEPFQEDFDKVEVKVVKIIRSEDLSQMLEDAKVGDKVVLLSINDMDKSNHTAIVTRIVNNRSTNTSYYNMQFKRFIGNHIYNSYGICGELTSYSIVDVIKPTIRIPKAETITINKVNTFGEF